MENIEKEITTEIQKIIQEKGFTSNAEQKAFTSSPELQEIIKNKIKTRNYLKEDWQSYYAVKRIKEKIIYMDLLPEEMKYISGSSLGAFLGSFFWPLGNKIYFYSFGYFIPFFNLYMAFHGRRISWEKGNWKDFNQFKKRQRILLWIFLTPLLLYFALAFFSIIVSVF